MVRSVGTEGRWERDTGAPSWLSKPVGCKWTDRCSHPMEKVHQSLVSFFVERQAVQYSRKDMGFGPGRLGFNPNPIN